MDVLLKICQVGMWLIWIIYIISQVVWYYEAEALGGKQTPKRLDILVVLRRFIELSKHPTVKVQNYTIWALAGCLNRHRRYERNVLHRPDKISFKKRIVTCYSLYISLNICDVKLVWSDNLRGEIPSLFWLDVE